MTLGRSVQFNTTTILSLICVDWPGLTYWIKPHTQSDTKFVHVIYSLCTCAEEKIILAKKIKLMKIMLFKLAIFNPLSASTTKWSNTLKQFVLFQCV